MPPKAANLPVGQTPHETNASVNRLRKGKREMSTKRQIELLRHSRTWDGLDPSIWKARKIVGIGGNGIAGLWEYRGTDPNTPKRMVIRQGKDIDGMNWEYRFLKILAGTGSDHFVKLYKAVYRTGGLERRHNSIHYPLISMTSILGGKGLIDFILNIVKMAI